MEYGLQLFSVRDITGNDLEGLRGVAPYITKKQIQMDLRFSFSISIHQESVCMTAGSPL